MTIFEFEKFSDCASVQLINLLDQKICIYFWGPLIICLFLLVTNGPLAVAAPGARSESQSATNDVKASVPSNGEVGNRPAGAAAAPSRADVLSRGRGVAPSCGRRSPPSGTVGGKVEVNGWTEVRGRDRRGRGGGGGGKGRGRRSFAAMYSVNERSP